MPGTRIEEEARPASKRYALRRPFYRIDRLRAERGTDRFPPSSFGLAVSALSRRVQSYCATFSGHIARKPFQEYNHYQSIRPARTTVASLLAWSHRPICSEIA